MAGKQDPGPNTIIQHLGEGDHPFHAIAPPIVQASNFSYHTVSEFDAAMTNLQGGEPYIYSRLTNPTLDLAERKIAKLEGAECCRLTGSGQGAITIALMANLEAGAHVVAVDTCYGPVKDLLDNYLPKFGVSRTYVSGLDADELIDSITKETKVIYLESPSSIVFRLQDLRRIAKAAKEKGVVTMIDNTYSTPLYQSPLEFGIDYVLHSGSKYFGGHSDLTAGAICSTNARMLPILKNEINLFAAALAPFPAWLLLRGLRTLSVRIQQVERTANTIAAWLQNRHEVHQVNHVSLPNFDQRDLFLSQMRGSTGLFSFQTKNQDAAKLRAFVEALELFGLGVSWGGHESLGLVIETHPLGYKEKRLVVRLYTGLEDAGDLIADLDQAFAVAQL